MISMLSKFDHLSKMQYQVGFRDKGAYEKIGMTQAMDATDLDIAC